MDIGEMDIGQNGNFEKFKFGKMQIWKNANLEKQI